MVIVVRLASRYCATSGNTSSAFARKPICSMYRVLPTVRCSLLRRPVRSMSSAGPHSTGSTNRPVTIRHYLVSIIWLWNSASRPSSGPATGSDWHRVASGRFCIGHAECIQWHSTRLASIQFRSKSASTPCSSDRHFVSFSSRRRWSSKYSKSIIFGQCWPESLALICSWKVTTEVCLASDWLRIVCSSRCLSCCVLSRSWGRRWSRSV